MLQIVGGAIFGYSFTRDGLARVDDAALTWVPAGLIALLAGSVLTLTGYYLLARNVDQGLEEGRAAHRSIVGVSRQVEALQVTLRTQAAPPVPGAPPAPVAPERTGPVVPAAPSGVPFDPEIGLAATLARLAGERHKGLLTQEEYSAERARAIRGRGGDRT